MNFQAVLKEQKKLVNVIRLNDTKDAVTLKKATIIDGPFAETKEQFVGLYVINAKDFADATKLCQLLPEHIALEIRPIRFFETLEDDHDTK